MTFGLLTPPPSHRRRPQSRHHHHLRRHLQGRNKTKKQIAKNKSSRESAIKAEYVTFFFLLLATFVSKKGFNRKIKKTDSRFFSLLFSLEDFIFILFSFIFVYIYINKYSTIRKRGYLSFNTAPDEGKSSGFASVFAFFIRLSQVSALDPRPRSYRLRKGAEKALFYAPPTTARGGAYGGSYGRTMAGRKRGERFFFSSLEGEEENEDLKKFGFK